MTKYLFTVLCSCLFLVNTSAQITNVSISDDFEAYRDSLKETEYEWRLPIMGAKLRKMGFALPYPNGVSVQAAFSRQDIDVSNVRVGFSDGDLLNVDNIARFNSISSEVYGMTARYDFWLLPFLNFYGLVGRISTNTRVELALPFELNFDVGNSGTIAGFGTVVAGAVGPLAVAFNYTHVWSWVSALGKPNQSNVLQLQSGYVFRFKKRPQTNVVFLVGAQYLGISKESQGSWNISDAIGLTNEKKESASEQWDDWYEELSQKEMELLEPLYDGVSSLLNDEDPLELKYEFDKQLYYPVSLTLAFNFQWNYRWALTGQAAFLGSREQYVLNLNYRFGFKGKNMLKGFTL